MKRVGLALGGGGARGYAHIPVLEVLDELGIRPHAIAGTSIGSIIGAMYASGMRGAEIRRWVGEAMYDRGDSLRDIVRKREELLKWFDVLVPDFGGRGLVRSDRIVERLLAEIRVSTFEQLEIPLRVVATDFWAGEPVVFRAGELLPAVRASMAVPGVFAPVTWAERVLVDGGLVNLVPYDLVQDDCDVTIAVNVGRHPRPPSSGEPLEPRLFDLLRYSIDLMQLARFRERARQRPPDILLEPEVGDTRIFQFDRAQEVMDRARPAAEELRTRLPAALAGGG